MNPLYFFYYSEKLMKKSPTFTDDKRKNLLFRDTKLLVRCKTFLCNDSVASLCLITPLLLTEAHFFGVVRTLTLRER